MLESVWSGRTTRSRSTIANASHEPTTTRVSVQRTLRLKSPRQSRIIDTSTAGNPASRASRKISRSWCGSRGGWSGRATAPDFSTPPPVGGVREVRLETMRRDAPVERAPRQPQRLRGAADVALVARQRFLNEHFFNVLERQLVEA